MFGAYRIVAQKAGQVVLTLCKDSRKGELIGEYNFMTPEEAKELPNQKKLHPMLANLPAYLKDPANYDKIRLSILEAGATKHSHGEVGEWALCKHCQQKEWDRKEFMLKLGFKTGAQYKSWQRVHEEIIRRDPLVKWK